MSLENATTGEPNPSSLGQGRREPGGQQPASVQRSGGVCVDSASGRPVRVNWEDSGVGTNRFQPAAQAGSAREAAGDAGEVGVPHSSVDLHYFKRCKEPRGDTYSTRRGGAEDAGMAGATQIRTPDKVRSLQIALYRKAKAEPKYRFWSLYGELCRRDVLETALRIQLQNDGAAGVDGQTLADINATPQTRQDWLSRLQTELKTKTYRPSSVRRVMIAKSGGGQRPLGIPTVEDRVVQTAVVLVLMPVFEADFHPHSYGFRPKRRAHQAIEAINQAIRQGYVEIIDADLSKYLDPYSYYTLAAETGSKSSGWLSKTRMRKPFCLPRLTWTTESSPRFTRCMIVWRETPRLRMACGMGT